MDTIKENQKVKSQFSVLVDQCITNKTSPHITVFTGNDHPNHNKLDLLRVIHPLIGSCLPPQDTLFCPCARPLIPVKKKIISATSNMLVVMYQKKGFYIIGQYILKRIWIKPSTKLIKYTEKSVQQF